LRNWFAVFLEFGHCVSAPRKTPARKRFLKRIAILFTAILVAVFFATEPAQATAQVWVNTSGNTDFNSGASWVGGTAPGVNDVGRFDAAAVAQPNLSSSLSISGLFFNGGLVSGYDVTSTAGAAFTLTGQNTSGSSGSSDGSAAAIRASNTSGTNTIDAPLILASTTGTSTFFQTVNGVLVVNGDISSSGNVALSLRGGGDIVLNGTNTYTGGTSTDVAAAQGLIVGNDSALGTGTFSVNTNTTIQAGGGAHTIGNAVMLNVPATLSVGGANNLTFSGPVTVAGNAVSKDINVFNAATTTFGGSLFLSDLAAAGKTLTIQGSGAVVISGVVSDFDGAGTAGTLQYNGAGSLTLNNTNTFSGGTKLLAGTIIALKDGAFGTGNVSLTAANLTLTLQGGATNNYIADTASLSYKDTDTINLEYTGTDVVAALIVDGVSLGFGTYGAGATNPDGAFTGTGFIAIIPEPAISTLLGLGLLLGVQRLRRK
jgi:autotransporter-associated beta strand protein